MLKQYKLLLELDHCLTHKETITQNNCENFF